MLSPKSVYYTRSLPEGSVQLEELSISTYLILNEAEKFGIRWNIIPDTDIIELSYQNTVRVLRSRFPDTTSYTGAKICYDKQLGKVMLKRNGLEVVPGFVIYENDSDDRIESVWQALQKPLVLKPTLGSYGEGVEIGLTNFSDCLNKIRKYFKKPLYDGGLILEQMFFGKEYRILANREKVIGIMERVPAHIIGDGQNTIEELIRIENNNPLRNINDFLYPHIILDNISLEMLKEQNLTLTSVPQKDQYVALKRVSNIMAGGVGIDRTDEAHESVKEIALKAIRAIPGLSWTGIDFMTTDITIPQIKGNYTIIEMNCAPGFAIHDMPMQGKPRGAAREFIYLMFPQLC